MWSHTTRSRAVQEPASQSSGIYLTALNRYDEARASAREALELAREDQADADVAFAIQHLAAIGALQANGDGDARVRAARLVGFVDARLAQVDSCREFTEQREYEVMIGALRDELGSQQLHKQLKEGNDWDEDRAVSEAMEV